MMRNWRLRRIWPSVCAVALSAFLLLSACGADDTPPADTVPTNDTSAATTDATPTSTTVDTTEATEASARPADASVACRSLFSDDEVAELFGEPAALESEEANESLGNLVCAWGTIEDPDDLEDLAAQTLTVQVYFGDPIPAENFYDPSIYEDAREINGVGDEAFVANLPGISTAFLDGNLAGFVSYAAISFDDSAQTVATEDQIIDLLQTLHDRLR